MKKRNVLIKCGTVTDPNKRKEKYIEIETKCKIYILQECRSEYQLVVKRRKDEQIIYSNILDYVEGLGVLMYKLLEDEGMSL